MNWLVRQKQTRGANCDCNTNCDCKTTPMKFEGANSKNSSCWDGYKKCGTKPSPSGTGETVNNCIKESQVCKKKKK